jgi:hypothetical protein
MSFQKELIENHNELLAIVKANYEVNKKQIKEVPFFYTKLNKAIKKGNKIKKSIAITTDS